MLTHQVIDSERQTPALPWPQFIDESDGARLIYQLKQHANSNNCAVQFVAAHRGEGTSSIVRDIGLIGVMLGLRILLLDLSQLGRGQAAWLRARVSGTSGLVEFHSWKVPAGKGIGLFEWPDLRILRVDETNLCVSEATTDLLPVSARYADILTKLSGAFDLVLVDSAPFEQSADALLVAQFVAASVLVVAAEATHVKVVENLRNRILQVDGRIAGLLLNKRRFHIPRTIYEWL